MVSPVSLNDDDLTPAERQVTVRVGELHDVDFAAMAAVANVYRVANAVRNHMEREVLGPDRLSWSGFTALYVLWVWGDQESRHLADECSVTRATLTGIVNTLEGRGLVTRNPSADDGRSVIVSLTRDGQAMIERLFPAFNRQEAFVTNRLSDDERCSLAHLLREVLRAVNPD